MGFQILLIYLLMRSLEAWQAAPCSIIRVDRTKIQAVEKGGAWEKISEIVTVENRWVKVVGERLQDTQGKLLDYWRVEKDHSAVILTIHRGRLILPRASFRPGVGYATLDFPGGRVPPNTKPESIVTNILQRELGVTASDISRIETLNSGGWMVNSSFSNQLLFGFVVTLTDNVILDSRLLNSKSYSCQGDQDLENLLSELRCLQCRAVLLEWRRRGQ